MQSARSLQQPGSASSRRFFLKTMSNRRGNFDVSSASSAKIFGYISFRNSVSISSRIIPDPSLVRNRYKKLKSLGGMVMYAIEFSKYTSRIYSERVRVPSRIAIPHHVAIHERCVAASVVVDLRAIIQVTTRLVGP